LPFQKLPTSKSPKQKNQGKAQAQAKAPKNLSPKSPPKPKAKTKSPQPSFSGTFINSGKQGGTEAVGEGLDIVTGETCVPASLNTSLGDAAVPLFLFRDQDCAYLGLQEKAIKPHLTLLTSSSHRLFIIQSPQSHLLLLSSNCISDQDLLNAHFLEW
jgi:hypothetical protein